MKYFYVIIILLQACTTGRIDYYHGYIYNNDKKIIEGLKVNTINYKYFSYTNKKGYFNINIYNKDYSRFLIIADKDDYIIDTLVTSWRFPDVGGINYQFVNGKNDTLFIDLK